jgi:hypothetical protein
VKQFVKNKRKNHYSNGWLEVPEKYAHLKQNSSKRNPTASRSKKAMRGSINKGREGVHTDGHEAATGVDEEAETT